MNSIFTVRDRQIAFEHVTSAARECGRITSLVQVGSGAVGFRDDRSDLDFVIALDSDASMTEVMDYMHRKLAEKYDIIYFSQSEAAHLQVFLLSDMLEIDIGYGCYEHAAARKPAFRVIYDDSGTVEEKMTRSREWMDDSIYGGKWKKDAGLACGSAWAHLMHAAVAINRGGYLRAVGELDCVRKLYADLLGDRFRLESDRFRELDALPEEEKAALKRTFVTDESPEALWTSLDALTDAIYRELEGCGMPVTKEMLLEYYRGLR